MTWIENNELIIARKDLKLVEILSIVLFLKPKQPVYSTFIPLEIFQMCLEKRQLIDTIP